MLVATLLIMAAAVPEADIVKALRAGKMLCANPDQEAKTCSSIDRYAASGGNRFVNTGEVLLSPEQGLTMEVTSMVSLEIGALCGTLDLADLRKARLRANGVQLPPAQRAAMIAQMVEQMTPLAGRRVCETLQIEDGQLTKQGQMEGVDVALPSKPVIWIAPGSGYKVAP